MTDTKAPEVEVFEQPQPGRKRRYTTSQKQAILDEAAQPGNSISGVARRFGISPSLVFRWKKAQDAGALAGLAADEPVVAESEVKELKAKVRELERLLGTDARAKADEGQRPGSTLLRTLGFASRRRATAAMLSSTISRSTDSCS